MISVLLLSVAMTRIGAPDKRSDMPGDRPVVAAEQVQAPPQEVSSARNVQHDCNMMLQEQCTKRIAFMQGLLSHARPPFTIGFWVGYAETPCVGSQRGGAWGNPADQHDRIP